MSVLLCFNRFRTASEPRNAELDAVFAKTLTLTGVKILLCDDGAFVGQEALPDNVIRARSTERPTYKSWIDEATSLSDQKCTALVICNSDIFIPQETIESIRTISGNRCYALTRWDVTSLDDQALKRAVFFEQYHACSQDVWVIPLPVKNSLLSASIGFPLGVWGCDNRFCYELKHAGYNVTNPSRTLRTYHLHTVQIPRKTHAEEHVEKPYLTVAASALVSTAD